MKRGVVWICFSLLLFQAASATPRPKVDGKTVLRLSNVPEPGQKGREEIDLFLKLNPDITLVQSEGIGVEGIGQSRLFLAMAAGIGPDVFYGSLADLETYYQQHFLAPVTDLYERDKAELLPIKERIKPIVYQKGQLIAVPKFYKVMALANRRDLLDRRLGESGDHPPRDWNEWFQWCLKLSDPSKGVYGLGLYGGSWIFEIYVWLAGGEMVQQFKVDPVDGSLVASLPGYGPKGETLFPKTNPATGSNLESVTPIWRTTIDSPPAIRALNFHRRLLWVEWIRAKDSGNELVFVDYPDYDKGEAVTMDEVTDPVTKRVYHFKKGDSNKPSDDTVEDDKGNVIPVFVGVAKAYMGGNSNSSGSSYNNDFLEGRLAMMPTAGGRDAVFDDRFSPALVGLTMFPVGPPPTGRPATEINGGFLCLSSQITDPDVRNAAWRWIKFVNGGARQALKVKEWVQEGLAAYVMPEWLKKYGYAEYINEVPESWVQQNTLLESVARPESSAPGFRAAEREIAGLLELAYSNPKVNAAKELKRRAAYINRFILQENTESKIRKLRPYAYAVAALIGVILLFVIRTFWKSVTHSAKKAPPVAKNSNAGLRVHLVAWALMLPAIALVLTFEYYPLLKGSLMAFQDYFILGDKTFVGLDNFIAVLTSEAFWHALGMTLIYAGMTLSLGFFTPIILALLLSEIPILQYFFRTVFFLPAVTTGVVISLLWKQFFDPSPSGVANHVFALFGLGPFTWLHDAHLAMLCIIIPGIWASAGPGCLLYLAALKTVSQDLYEAADIDGAGWFRKIRNVSLPTIFPFIIINFIGAFIGSFQSFQNVFVMTGGGPDRATQVLGFEIWMNAFVYLKFGYATAMAWVLGAALFGFVVLKMRLLEKMDFRTAD